MISVCANKSFHSALFCKSTILYQSCRKPGQFTLLWHEVLLLLLLSLNEILDTFSLLSKFNYGSFERKCSCMSVPTLMD